MGSGRKRARNLRHREIDQTEEAPVTPTRDYEAEAQHFIGLLEKEPGAGKKADDDIVSGLMAVALAILAVKESIDLHRNATGTQ